MQTLDIQRLKPNLAFKMTIEEGLTTIQHDQAHDYFPAGYLAVILVSYLKDPDEKYNFSVF